MHINDSPKGTTGSSVDYLTTLIHLGFSHKPCIITVFMLCYVILFEALLVYSPVVRVVPYGVIDRGVWLPLVKKSFPIFDFLKEPRNA